ncbi:MAG: flagellar assembly protein FliH [Gallionellaceae bacterium]|nr:MAG: flagellar assembly protein FliH [Gallionellaceae bacterium]
MSDLLTPKEQLTAYERWELPSFDAGGDIRISGNPNGMNLPTAAELETIQLQAREEGFQAGYAEGAQKAALETQRLAALVASMEQALQNVDRQVAQSLLDLALELAQQMLHQALKVNPELLLEVIRAAIASLPHFNPGAHIVLHPDDAKIVRERMGEQLAHSGWKIFEDAHLTRGGARVETAHSQIDATVETRWHRISANLGQESSWLKND